MQKIMFLFALLTSGVGGLVADQPAATSFFNGSDLKGWQGNTKYWSVKEGMIVGESTEYLPGNEFLWSDETVADFYLSFDVRLVPNTGNSGVQFRSRPGKGGSAIGYQADIGKGSWGCLYEEHGRAFLDWPASGEKRVKPDDWNHYEILAVGHRIWSAINGEISVAIDDPDGALKGQIALQLHAGPAMKLEFKALKLLKNPPLAIAGKQGKALLDTLRPRIEKLGAAPVNATEPSQAFLIRDDDVIVFTGGTNSSLAQRYGYLESILTRATEGKVRFRNMAWQADTVYRQQRPVAFGDWAKQLARVKPTVIVAAFGQSEAMDGPQRIGQFIGAYDRLLNQFSEHCDQIVIVSPFPFETPELPLPDLADFNNSLSLYVAAIRDLAARRGDRFVDLFSSPVGGVDKPLTANGMHLTEFGQRQVALESARQLGIEPYSGDDLLRRAVLAKNRLWYNYWRPTNWAFLGGTRTMVPFSRDPSHKERTFPAEMEDFLPLIVAAEENIRSLATPGTRAAH